MTSTRRRLRLAAALVLLASLSPAASIAVRAQQASSRPNLPLPPVFLQGYDKPLSGDVLVYPWAYPGQIETLISRATTGQMAVEWQGEPVPPGPPDEFIAYLWNAGLASGYGSHAFTLSVNDRVCATFKTARTVDDREWVMRGAGASELWFKTTRVGAFNEMFGFMWIRAPRSFFGTGAPRFRVVGEAANNQDYYLGQKAQVRSWLRVRPEEAVLAGGQRAIRLEASIVGAPAQVVLRSGSRTLWTGTAQPGHTSMTLPAGPNQDSSLPIQVDIDGRESLEETLQLKRVRTREMHLLPHSHVDIGYSDPQPAVERKQWKNLKDAVALARKTAAYPVDARFKWNVEGLWSVESYLKQAPADERDAFIAAVKAGSIGMQANYTNVLTGLMTPEELRHWTDASRQLRAAYGFGPMRSAMHSDIPGLNWTVVAALAQAGVRYFSSGPNYVPGFPDLGDRIGTTIKALGDKPFWWTSPSGEERILFWMAGRGYSWFHGLNNGQLTSASRDAILDYVGELVSSGYEWDLIQTRYTIGGDNGPTDPSLPDIVKSWNEQFDSPRLVIDTAENLFAELERRHGAALPTRPGDMTPYWEDGAVSTAAEEAMVRAAVRRLTQAQALYAIRGGSAYPSEKFAEAWRNVLLWHEHTWGAADSVSQPDRADVVAQWEYKRAFASQAENLSKALIDDLLSPSGDLVEVVNSLTWKRAGLVLVPQAQSRAGDRVRSAGDNRLRPSQRLLDGRLAVWLDDVPALGALRLRIEAGAATPPTRSLKATRTSIDNGQVRIDFDPATGAVSALSWKRPASAGAPKDGVDAGIVVLGRNLLDFVYVPGREPAEGQHPKAAELWLDDQGPLVATIRVVGDAPGGTSLVRSLQVAVESDIITATVDYDKRKVRAKESAHLAFPLAVGDGVVRVDQGEAMMEPDRNQLPGSCKDFAGVQSVFDVSNADVGVSVASLDAPLVELGAITDERLSRAQVRQWREKAAPGTTVWAYLLNNYWHTNYKADQDGLLRFRFAIRPHGAFDATALKRFSDEQDAPLLLANTAGSAPASRAPFTVLGPNVIVSLVEPTDGGKALLIRLYNPSTIEATTAITPATAGAKLYLLDPSTGEKTALSNTVKVPARATRMVRLER